MPILLDSPFNPGDNDPGKSYPQVKITDIHIDLCHHIIRLMWSYGEEVSGVWQRGLFAPPGGAIIGDDAYDEVITSNIEEEDDELIYEGVKRVLYDYLIEKNLVAGEVIP